jgi:hypothetical protein
MGQHDEDGAHHSCAGMTSTVIVILAPHSCVGMTTTELVILALHSCAGINDGT